MAKLQQANLLDFENSFQISYRLEEFGPKLFSLDGNDSFTKLTMKTNEEVNKKLRMENNDHR